MHDGNNLNEDLHRVSFLNLPIQVQVAVSEQRVPEAVLWRVSDVDLTWLLGSWCRTVKGLMLSVPGAFEVSVSECVMQCCEGCLILSLPGAFEVAVRECLRLCCEGCLMLSLPSAFKVAVSECLMQCCEGGLVILPVNISTRRCRNPNINCKINN
jgi:hypothetical protein